MWTYYPELIARPAPRYTSYPTAAEFNGSVGAEDYAKALENIAEGSAVSLYVHIPFCEEICWYCGCNTAKSNRPHRLTAYVEALIAEVDMVSSALAGKARVKRIAFGGGSPNALGARQFAQLVVQIITAFGAADPLLSIELDPRRVTDEWLSVMETIGFSYASLGVQTFDDNIQAAIGRIQPFEQVVELTQRLRAARVKSLNFDLMYGLPGQDNALLEDTLEKVIDMRPERIALFGYAHLPKLLPRQRRIDDSRLPGTKARFAMAALGHEKLCAAGYQAVGFDHYALPNDPLAQSARNGTLQRNFQGFTEDDADVLIGFGATSISQFGDVIVQNAKNMGQYREAITEKRFSADRGVKLNAEDQAHGAIIQQILCQSRCTLPPEMNEAQISELEQYVAAQLVRLEGNELILEDGARPYMRAIASIFDAYRPVSSGQFSMAV